MISETLSWKNKKGNINIKLKCQVPAAQRSWDSESFVMRSPGVRTFLHTNAFSTPLRLSSHRAMCLRPCKNPGRDHKKGLNETRRRVCVKREAAAKLKLQQSCWRRTTATTQSARQALLLELKRKHDVRLSHRKEAADVIGQTAAQH